MSEPSNMPPLWTGTYIASLMHSDFFDNLDNRFTMSQQIPTMACFKTEFANKYVNANPWELIFTQPASDYLAFCNKLDRDSVSLENVIVREIENSLIGTIKVRNFSYDKTVTIRMTTDDWKSYEDVNCIYIQQLDLTTQTVVRNFYDTFRFHIPLPANDFSTSQVEFCVHYVTEGSDFWDNNSGANYIVKKARCERLR
jgi:protein phosphatase 1 regulatory subunit 3A/B/C/D/E